ncbi:hypothetical protein [Phycicoccus avicenniae]|uniref:hypothetical protein n=1 Tax=Phycicoccus avicenniae TaxID=2828860 RepID=UPI001B8C75B7|nr:hypothetical protein [Phycicoccus avicenniae]
MGDHDPDAPPEGTATLGGERPSVSGKAKAKSPSGSSPYATGGGGASFASSVATTYLASMLTGSRRPEASELPVRRVAFQTGPDHPVDDLLVTCSDNESEVTLAVACRATPNFVQSDDETVKLVGSLLAEVEKFDDDTHRVAVAAAGRSNQWTELGTLADIARAHADAGAFEASISVDGRWLKAVRDRYSQFQGMVKRACGSEVTDLKVSQLTWGLLSRLHVLTFAVQTPDESDRTAVATILDALADAATDGVTLRDKIEVETVRYDRTGAVVDLKVLRRDLHRALNVAKVRSRSSWKMLEEHRQLLAAGVRASIGDDTSGGAVRISFSDRRRERLTTALLAAGADGGSAVLVHGESGIGKSALTLSTVAELEAANPGGFEAVVLSFISLPHSTLELSTALGMSVQDVLAELSAPHRILVIDGADAGLERSAPLLSDLVVAAKEAGVGLVAVSSDVASDFVSEQLATGWGQAAVPFKVAPLSDDDVAFVAEQFPLLRPVLRDLPENSLLRRPVVLDLLARTGVKLDGKLSEWECLNLVWTNVVRSESRSGGGSAQAREQTLLAVAASVAQLPLEFRPIAGTDAEAIDALRRDHLLAPANPYREQPEFAHDEVRRYATAILLVRAQDLTQVLARFAVPRLALSAATLACKGLFHDTAVPSEQRFLRLLGTFQEFAFEHGARWADVPVEAVLETPNAYQCLTVALADKSTDLDLADVVRIVVQRHKDGGLIDPAVAGAVVRILLDYEKPWDVSKESFELLADCLQALILADAPEGNELRIALRARLLEHWNAYPPREPQEDDEMTAALRSSGFPTERRRRRRGDLDYHVTQEEFVETLALLGPDLDDEAEACLRVLADDAPAFLAPAADSPVSARAVAQRDPELLATLMEAYYIDDEHRWHRDEGVRMHQGRWTGFGGPFFMYYFGGFWQLFQSAPVKTRVRVLNNILNSGARARVNTLARHNSPDPFSLPVDGKGGRVTADQGAAGEDQGLVLNLDGTPRLYIGDSHVWSWYRGTTVGPYSAMSALQAMERVIDTWLEHGIPASRVMEVVLEGCENLAVPGMLYGVLVRHLDKVGDALDSFLAEPVVWELEFARSTHEYSGLAASTEGLRNLERRRWTPREVAAALLTGGGEERAKVLKEVGEKLIENGDSMGLGRDLTMNWAASLDADRYKLTVVPEGLLIEVEPPPELLAAQEVRAAYQETVNTTLRLQNRYWGSAKHDADYVAPTSGEIAADLVTGHSLLEVEEGLLPNQPADAVAHVIRAAVERAAAGDPAALGGEAAFAAEFVLGLASSFRAVEDQREEGQYFDLGADRAVAHALPAFLTPGLSAALGDGGATVGDVADVGLAMAGKASLETRLFLARGCDVVWSAACNHEPCIHQTALDWLLETARSAELGPWDEGGFRREPAPIEGDVAARLEELPGDSVYIGVLDAAIRGLGAAAATEHCCTVDALALLARLLAVQSQCMVLHEERRWSADDRGTHSLVAARALLQSYARDGDPAPVLAHLDVLRADAGIMTNFLHGLMAAGAENANLADAARRLWPTVLRHGLTYQGDDQNPYNKRHWGDWAAAALLPDPLPWTSGLYNEVSGAPIDWVSAEDLVDLIDDWLPVGRGEVKSVDALIGLLRRLSLDVQATRGVGWVANLCIQSGRVTVSRSWFLDTWLKEVRNAAEELGRLDEWQMLVDSLVVAGNEGLAPYSR